MYTACIFLPGILVLCEYRLEICSPKLVIMLPVLYLSMKLMQLVEKEDHEILVAMMNVKIHLISYLLKWMVCVHGGRLMCVCLLFINQDLILIQMWW